jgi:ergothioneine biosynthesis protein EgtB
MTRPTSAPDPDARAALVDRFAEIRALSERLAAPLSPEDQCLQSMPDASPTKWHLAHTSWFFEALILLPYKPGYAAFEPRYLHLFNSYYEALGSRHPRPERGMLSRPALAEVLGYRRRIDEGITEFLSRATAEQWQAIASLVELGLQHEQQHQELILTDIKHALSRNPLLPAYRPLQERPATTATATVAPMRWIDCPGGVVDVGHDGASFAFDKETPRHGVLLHSYRLANRAVTNGEYLEFMHDGGYRRPEFWLSDGWAAAQASGWRAPLYWLPTDGDGWQLFTLNGVVALDPSEPVCHVSFYEATAYAAWAGTRLPTEHEWEAAAANQPAGSRYDPTRPHPRPAEHRPGLSQMFDDVWEWTRSAYDPYPGFRPFSGALGEYNGKFMVNQLVLRGGSCATPTGHSRASYRNFFPPAARWQFSGIRLAQDA